MFKWVPGRLHTGYFKILLFATPWPARADLYLLKFPVQSKVNPHTDPVFNRRHYRLNIIIKHAEKGGIFKSQNIIFQSKRIIFFRPDINEHSVTRVEEGTRYVLSIGWAIRN